MHERTPSSTPPQSIASDRLETADDPANSIANRRMSLEAETEEGVNCVICLDKISELCTTVPCGHSYDFVCILNWLELRQNCPLCNCLVVELHTCSVDGKIQKHSVEPPRPTSAPPASTSTSTPSSTSGRETFLLRNRAYTRSLNRRRRRRSPSPISEDTAILRRRFIYKHKLRSLYVGSNRMSRFRNVGPRDFREDEELVSRARMWVRRELQVWEWTNSNAEFLIEFVIGILKSVDLKGSAGQAEEMMTEILGREHAQIFIHELHAFLKSPFTSLRPFDEFVQYSVKIPRSLMPESLDSISSSSPSSSSAASSSRHLSSAGNTIHTNSRSSESTTKRKREEVEDEHTCSLDRQGGEIPRRTNFGSRGRSGGRDA
ncbi:RING finger domain protein [Peziza echinospora]|nr:RING finger domain protein [Peziza echinospora]